MVHVPPDHLFRLLVDSVTDYAIFLLDPQGHVTSWNAGAARLKGWTADEIVGKHFSTFYPDPAAARDGICARALAEAARVGRFEDEGWRVRKDGSRFWANVIVTAVRDEHGALVGFAKVTRDLTERRHAEEQRVKLAQAEEANRLKDEFLAREKAARRAVEEARSSLETTLRSIGDGVIATDAEGNVTLMNPVAEKLTGWPLEEARGRPLRACFHIINEDTRRVVESPVDRVLREGTVVGLANHTLLISRDGSEAAIHDSGAPIRDGAGNIRGVVLVFRDASEEAREAARRAFLAEATSVLGASLDYRDTFARVADVVVPRYADWCMVYGVEDESPVPVCLGAAHVERMKSELVHQLGAFPLDPGTMRGVMAVLQTGRPEHHATVTDAFLEERVTDPARLRILRELRLTSLAIAPLTVGRRVLGAVVLAYSDSCRRYDASDLGFIEEIGRRAGIAIENARLYAMEQRARDLADATSRMKDEFLATVSHELRTPLSSILGWATMLVRDGEDEGKRRRAIDTIERNARAMNQLIEDLLDVSRIVSGKMRIDLGMIDVATVVQGAVDSVRPAADAKQLRLTQHDEPGLPVIRGDAARLQQVVWNLLANAVKFTPRGGEVRVLTARAGDHVEIVVDDTGTGIEPQFLPHVFEAFRQADGSPTRKAGGLGLGLAIVKHIVEQHGGTVHASSDGRDRGATFTVSLPVPAASKEHGAPAQRAERVKPLARLDGLRVLVVDDDADTRELLGEALGSCGAQVTAVESVADAMREIARRTPDVLLSDVSMPGESGFDLIRRLRELPAGAGGRVPAAALTAYARQDDRRALLAAGYQLHISKPVDPQEICTLVSTLARVRIDG